MNQTKTLEKIDASLLRRNTLEAEKRLLSHPLYERLNDLENLKIFMENHVFAVWDFLILAKRVQEIFSQTGHLWQEGVDSKYTKFIDEILDAEEFDDLGNGQFMSHCELYLKAMKEVHASTDEFHNFQEQISSEDHNSYLRFGDNIPYPAYEFLRVTHAHAQSSKPHVTIAAFAYGREYLVPLMFQELLRKNMNLYKTAPVFYQYLTRHIDIDSESHGPLSEKLLNYAINNDPYRSLEAESVKLESILIRIFFYDKILNQIDERK